tara:strand:- start:323 stop:466 length:144 start_codon:yes stop_codon:yes gene_type:complete
MLKIYLPTVSSKNIITLNLFDFKEELVEVAGVEPASKASQIIRRSQG